ncbi:MAG: trypsin-like peptidase domain-containing protein [Planctomycetota bacterium]
MRRFVSAGPALLVLLACLAAVIGAPIAIDRMRAVDTRTSIRLAQQTIESDDILARIDRAVAAVADAVRPSVVHLDAATRSARRFGSSTGSGWVYDSRGHIITNAHVVRGAQQVRVQFADGRVDLGDVVSIDPFTDIAVIKVGEGPHLFPVVRSPDPAVSQGQRVFAFGSPFGFKFSMSEGIISGLGRDPATSESSEFGGFTNFIQTDAAVNPGNSGGPLVDARGELVGMNVAIATARDNNGTTEGDSAGISVAIPLLTIETVVDQLINDGIVQRGFLGVEFVGRFPSPRPVEVAGEFRRGVLINVVAGGPSDTAGLEDGDHILAINGQQITSLGIIRSIVGGRKPKEAISVEVARAGERMAFEVELGEMPPEVLASRSRQRIEQVLGFRLPVISPARPEPVVQVVVPGSLAAQYGIEINQRILSVGNRRVESVRDAFIAFQDEGLLNGEPVQITVLPDGAPIGEIRTLTIRLP